MMVRRLRRLAPLEAAGARRLCSAPRLVGAAPNAAHRRCWGYGLGAALAGGVCALAGGDGCVRPASAAAGSAPAAGRKNSWLPAKPGGGAREMPPVDPAGRPRVIFQGELGAYGETAIVQHFGGDGAIPVPCDDFESVRTLQPAWALTPTYSRTGGRRVRITAAGGGAERGRGARLYPGGKLTGGHHPQELRPARDA